MCEDFDIWEKCEPTNHKLHPLIKFKSPEAYNNFCYSMKYLYLSENKDEISSEDEADSIFIPKIIDSRLNEPCAVKLPNPLIKAKSNEYHAKFLESMPRSNYTTDIDQKSINLTCTVKNSGDKEWPSAFMVYITSTNFELENLDMHKLIQYIPVVDKKVNPNNEIKLDVMLLNPKMIGTFKYVLSMHTLDYVPFGEPFEFEFTIKDIAKTGWNDWACFKPR